MATKSLKVTGELTEVLNKIESELSSFDNKFIIYFVSTEYNQDEFAKGLKDKFSDSKIIGCSSNSEFSNNEMTRGSVTLISFDSETLKDVEISIIKDLNSKQSFDSAMAIFENYYSTKMNELSIEEYVGTVLIDGLTGAEENLMDSLGNISDVLFVGGSSSEAKLDFTNTYLHYEGEVFEKAAVLALFKPTKGYDFIKTQSFSVLENTEMIATKVDMSKRAVIEFNGKPASEEYARLLDINTDELAGKLMESPIGIDLGDDIFVRSPRVIEGTDVLFYCSVPEGMEVSILKTNNMLEDTKAVLEAKKATDYSAILEFNCILRTLMLENSGEINEYAKLFEGTTKAGFSTYGEEYLGHCNQTSTMLMIK